MKKIALLLMMCLLVSCQAQPQGSNRTDSGVDDVFENHQATHQNSIQTPATDTDTYIDPEAKTDTTQVKDPKPDVVKNAYDFDFKSMYTMTPYKETTYTPSQFVNKLHYSDIVNVDDFTNFTAGQIDMLNEHGFVVLQPSERPILKMHASYEIIGYNEVPIFITSDIILHMYHTFYSESMKLYEISIYYPTLKSLTKSLVEKSLSNYADCDSSIKEDLKFVTAYYGVAASLLKIDMDYPKEINDLIEIELSKISNASSPDKNIILNRKVDYSQYTVRGHYGMSEEFSDYFRTMMWYGQSGFDFYQTDPKSQSDARVRSLIATAIMFEDTDLLIKQYTSIYDLTSLYSGNSDNLNVYDMVEIIKSVYGPYPDLKLFRDTDYDEALENSIQSARKAEVTLVDGSSGVEFRFMGQRFTLDADVMQSLVDPKNRPESTALDFASACGNSTAESILRSYYQTNQNWPEFDEQLEDAKQRVASFEGYQANLYHGWLWAIEAVLDENINDSSLPMFMQNEAWAHKSLASALGSFTELKHDNILYAKQVMAECGDNATPPEMHHYVEPNVALYSRLLWLAENTLANIKTTSETLDIKQSYNSIEFMIDILRTCKDVAVKELENKTVTKDEMITLDRIGGAIDYMNRRYLWGLHDYCPDISDEHTTAMIADIATINGVVSEVATGLTMDIFVICNVNGQPYLTKGAVYSFYEFKSNNRLTDEQWQNMLGIYRDDTQGYLNTYYQGPTLNILEYMPWMSNYISSEKNGVKEITLEAGW